MASNGFTPGYPTKQDIASVIALVNSNTLLNRQLATVCTFNGLRSSGVKADLQRRIVERIRESAGDAYKFDQIVKHIRQFTNRSNVLPGLSPSPHTSPAPNHHSGLPPASSSSNNAPAAYQYQTYQGAGQASQVSSFMAGGHQSQQHQNHNQNQRPMPGYQFAIPFTFKPSPFYEPRLLLADVKTCEPVPQNRHMVFFLLKGQDLQRHLTDPSMRVMVFCAAANTGVQDIAFPHAAEIKVNSGDVKANLRGLKNKPGSTRPVDITDLLRQKPATYDNRVEFTYATTHKGGQTQSFQRFYLCVYVCKTHSVASLTQRISTAHNRISRASVVLEITRKARDTEIVTTSQKLSLKCPLSYMRLDLPVRSTACKHIQCFDATSYLQLQEQGPQWLCPICSQLAPFERLAVDEYAREILANTPKSVEQVTIEPDGEWRLPGAETVEVKDEKSEASYIDDDDVIISDISFLGRHRSTATPNQSSVALPSTPNTGASREGSSMPRSATASASAAGTKRPAPPVIDLTLSDSDDDPQPPPKRQNLGASNGWYA